MRYKRSVFFVPDKERRVQTEEEENNASFTFHSFSLPTRAFSFPNKNMDLDDETAPQSSSQSSTSTSSLFALLDASVAAAALARSSAATAAARDAAKKRAVASGSSFEAFEALVRTATLVPLGAREAAGMLGKGGGGKEEVDAEGRRAAAATATATVTVPSSSSLFSLGSRGFDAEASRRMASSSSSPSVPLEFVLHLRRDGTPVVL